MFFWLVSEENLQVTLFFLSIWLEALKTFLLKKKCVKQATGTVPVIQKNVWIFHFILTFIFTHHGDITLNNSPQSKPVKLLENQFCALFGPETLKR